MLGEGRIGKADVTPEELGTFGNFVAGRHLYSRMARPGPDRSAEVRSLAELLTELRAPRRARRILDQLFSVGRFVDIYPLEVLDALVVAAPGYLEGVFREGFVTNRRFLESRMFESGAPMPLELPLSATLWAFALEGGGAPGYCLSPGPPGRYFLEMGGEGRWTVLLAARVRGRDLIDRLRLWVEDPPPSR